MFRVQEFTRRLLVTRRISRGHLKCLFYFAFKLISEPSLTPYLDHVCVFYNVILGVILLLQVYFNFFIFKCVFISACTSKMSGKRKRGRTRWNECERGRTSVNEGELCRSMPSVGAGARVCMCEADNRYRGGGNGSGPGQPPWQQVRPSSPERHATSGARLDLYRADAARWDRIFYKIIKHKSGLYVWINMSNINFVKEITKFTKL